MLHKRIERSKNIIRNYLLHEEFELETYNDNIFIFTKQHRKVQSASFCIIMTVSKFRPNIQLSSCYTLGSFGFSTRKMIYKWSKDEVIMLYEIKYKVEQENNKFRNTVKSWNNSRY